MGVGVAGGGGLDLAVGDLGDLGVGVGGEGEEEEGDGGAHFCVGGFGLLFGWLSVCG